MALMACVRFRPGRGRC